MDNSSILNEILSTLNAFKLEEEKRWEESDKRFAKVFDILEQHSIALNDLSERLSSLENKVDSLENKISLLEDRVASLEKRMSSLENEFNLLKDKVNNLEVKINNLEVKINNLEVKVNNLEVKVNNLEDNLLDLKSDHLLLKNEFKRVIEIIEQHFENFKLSIDDRFNEIFSIFDKTELRLKKIESTQRYFEKVEETQSNLIDLHSLKLRKISQKIRIS